MQSKACGSDTQTFRPLTKDEIDQRIETLVADLATSSGNEERQAVLERNCRPRWISAAELVHRMRSFIVLN